MSLFSFGKKTVNDLPLPSFEEIKNRTTILVIDDDAESFPVSAMQRENYQITYWPKVEAMVSIENGQYDIIILDIQGVAQHISKDDGLGVLELLKQRNPSQIVVAFSSHSFDLGKNRFWKMADDSICKPVDLAKCKTAIDNLIQTKRTPTFYWDKIKFLLNQQNVPPRDIAKMEDQVVRSILDGNSKNATDAIRKILVNADIAVTAVRVVTKIAVLCGL